MGAHMKIKLLTITLLSFALHAEEKSHGLENAAPLENGQKLEDSTNLSLIHI